MKEEIVVITEDQCKLLYELLHKPYMVNATIVLYSYAENGSYTDIALEAMNDGGRFTTFNLQYNTEEHTSIVFKYGYFGESYENLVDTLNRLIESDSIKDKIKRYNGEFFWEDKNIVIKTYKSA